MMKKKKVAFFESQVGELLHKIQFQAKRLEFDLSDDVVTDRLIEIGNGSMADDATEEAYAERFLGIAYIQFLIALDSTEDEEIIAALCLGNWLAGILGGMPETGHAANVCIPCIIKDHVSESASMRAKIGHSKNNMAREFVRREWAKHKGDYGGNKSEFSRVYVRRVKNELDVTITEKQMREVWLADTPLASKQAG